MMSTRTYTAPFNQAKKEGLQNDISTSGKIGPGEYRNVDSEMSARKRKVRGGVIASAKVTKESIICSTPGPNRYEPNLDSVKVGARSSSIGRASLTDRGEIVPYGKNGFHLNLNQLPNVGPGSYSARIDSIK